MKNFQIKIYKYFEHIKTTAKNRNFIVSNLLKMILMTTLFTFNIAFLFTLENNFFRFGSLAPSNSLYRVLFNVTQQWRDINATNIISALLFYLMIIFSLLKNYLNVNKNEILLKKYSPFYAIYLLYSFAVIGIYFSLNKITASLDVWYLVIIASLVFMIINISRMIVSTMFSFKKMDPMEIKNQRTYIVSYVFRLALYILAFYLGYAFFNINSQNVLFNNEITVFLKSLFITNSPLNTFAITGIITLLIILFFVANLQTLYKVFKKNRTITSFKEIFIFLGIIFSSIIVWLFSKFTQINENYTIFESTSSYQYVFLSSAIINILITISYIVIKKLNLVKRDVVIKTLDYNLIFIIWVINTAIQISIETNFIISFINLLTALIATFVVLANTIFKEKTMMLENQILLILFLLSVLTFSFLSIFKIDLINNGNFVVYRQVFGIDVITFVSIFPAFISFILASWKGLSISIHTYNIGLKRSKIINQTKVNEELVEKK